MKLSNFFTVLITIYTISFELCRGYSNGAPVEACVSFYPGHGYKALSGSGQWRIRILSSSLFGTVDSYTPGKILQVSITSSKPQWSLRGVMIQARRSVTGTLIAGQWVGGPQGYITMKCNNTADTTTHTSNAPKPFTRFPFGEIFSYSVPETESDDIYFTATIVESYSAYYVDVKSYDLSIKASRTTRTTPTTTQTTPTTITSTPVTITPMATTTMSTTTTVMSTTTVPTTTTPMATTTVSTTTTPMATTTVPTTTTPMATTAVPKTTTPMAAKTTRATTTTMLTTTIPSTTSKTTPSTATTVTTTPETTTAMTSATDTSTIRTNETTLTTSSTNSNIHDDNRVSNVSVIMTIYLLRDSTFDDPLSPAFVSLQTLACNEMKSALPVEMKIVACKMNEYNANLDANFQLTIHHTKELDVNNLSSILMMSFNVHFDKKNATLNVDAQSTTDFNECESENSNDCSVYADCVNIPGSFRCACKSGYVDTKNVNPGRSCAAQCEINPCLNDGICKPNNDGPVLCQCSSGYGGDTCESKISLTFLELILVIVILILVLVVLPTILALCCIWKKRKRNQKKVFHFNDRGTMSRSSFNSQFLTPDGYPHPDPYATGDFLDYLHLATLARNNHLAYSEPDMYENDPYVGTYPRLAMHDDDGSEVHYPYTLPRPQIKKKEYSP